MKHPTLPNLPEWLLRVKRARMLDWLGVAALLSVLVWLMAPQQLPVSVYKLSLVAMAAVAGYWLDRSLFPYARPDLFLDLHVNDAGQHTGKAVEFFSFTEQHTAEQLSGGCAEFCVNGLLAGDCRLVRSCNEQEETRRT